MYTMHATVTIYSPATSKPFRTGTQRLYDHYILAYPLFPRGRTGAKFGLTHVQSGPLTSGQPYPDLLDPAVH